MDNLPVELKTQVLIHTGRWDLIETVEFTSAEKIRLFMNSLNPDTKRKLEIMHDMSKQQSFPDSPIRFLYGMVCNCVIV